MFKIFVLLNILQAVYSSRPFVIGIDTLRYEFNTNLTKSMTLQLLENGRRNKIRGNFSYAVDLYEFSIISWAHILRNNGQRPVLYNITIDGCEFLENALGKANPIFGGIMKNVRNFIPELPPKCPVRKVSWFVYDN
ncbi:uncharacterized protein LOC106094992 [Stomoxys calcitrans]|uniref:uncharacterized protein LOC106094992 n=1 Tax=Stomoxys calcitrans TaxID=35570 RepID=UPI0027E2FDF1|nr:uncharacterized protein LOC106094992 [Stomoxys calcitrans]